MLLQLDQPPLNSRPRLSNRLVDQPMRLLTRQSTFKSQSAFKSNGEPMSQSTHDRHSSVPTLKPDGNVTNRLAQTHRTTDDLAVVVVDESCITRFNYWDQGICQGMTLRNDLYTCFQCFTSALRFKAYDVGYSFAEKGIIVCISVSDAGYCVWLNLRSLSTEMSAQIRAHLQSNLSSQPSF